ncbi:MAG: tetratricopeptide repeat protein [Gammaproteobacteria bacterium]|nr:tetratricopeptide repeat protein [Gammaproteobacteria bacterium]
MLVNLPFLPIILLVLFLFGCTTTPNKENSEPVDSMFDEPVHIIAPPVETQVYYMKPVVKKLLHKAISKITEKDYHSAVSLLEQAIDISPNNPYVWQQLALVRLKQQNYTQAEQMAAKSNVVGEANNELRMKNWQIIAEAKRGQQKMHVASPDNLN